MQTISTRLQTLHNCFKSYFLTALFDKQTIFSFSHTQRVDLTDALKHNMGDRLACMKSKIHAYASTHPRRRWQQAHLVVPTTRHCSEKVYRSGSQVTPGSVQSLIGYAKQEVGASLKENQSL